MISCVLAIRGYVGGHELAASGVIGDRCRRGRTHGAEQVSAPEIQFSTRHALRVLCGPRRGWARFHRLSCAQGSTPRGARENALNGPCVAVRPALLFLNGHVQSQFGCAFRDSLVWKRVSKFSKSPLGP